jgi:hypothetical protein
MSRNGFRVLDSDLHVIEPRHGVARSAACLGR